MQDILRKILLIAAMLFSLHSYSQLVANFTVTNLGGTVVTGGCSPLIIRMNDQSTNNGSPVLYQSVANGNSYNSHTWTFSGGTPPPSNLQNPVAGFVTPGNYVITLVVFNGVSRDTFSRVVTVYPNPTVDFTATVTTGCEPLNVCFTDLSTSGNLSVTNWTWDFCDGGISTQQNPCHTFVANPNVPGRCFCVTLIAVNSQGCSNSLTRNNYICLTPPPTANFYSTQRLICSPPFSVAFFDSSISVNGLAYQWNFGDPASGVNNTSTDRNPVHVFSGTGNYNITLTVRDTLCNQTATITKNSYIRIGNIQANFGLSEDTVCLGTAIQFSDSSVIAPTSWLWNFGIPGATSTQQNPSYTYPNAGRYTVSLTVSDATGCTDDTVMTNVILVRPVPTANITSSGTVSCRAPFSVSFNSNASPGVTYLWNFGDNSISTQANPVHTYNNPGNFTVTLTVRNAFGCTYTTTRVDYVQIAPTVVNFTMDNQQGCAPLVVNFTDASTSLDPIVSRQWNFGDPASGINDTSTLTNPSHTFNAVGTYNVTLTITTQGGCTATYSSIVRVGNPPFINFSVSATQVCVNVPIIFTDLSGGNPTSYLWDFVGGTANTPNATYTYDEPGTYNVTYTIGANGCTSDTSVVITVLDPRADFNFSINCNFFGRVTFTNTSTNATGYTWAFGDNPPTTSTLANPVKNYLTAGTYSVTLTATNSQTGCTAEMVKPVTISNTQADFVADSLIGCIPFTVNFTNNSTGTGLAPVWTFGPPGATSTQPNPSYIYNQQGTFTVTLTVTDVNGCSNTRTRTAYIRVSDVNPDFIAQVPYGCLPRSGSPAPVINFIDQSTTPVGVTISNWMWDFGNGIQNFSMPGSPPPATVTRTYGAAGLYDVTLTVTTNLGCRKSFTRNQYIDIQQPRADFYLNHPLYCPNQDVPFINSSTGSGLSYVWNFGDPNYPGGGTSTAANPTHAYADTGYYTVSLIVSDIYGCRDTVVKPNTVHISSPFINFQTNDTFRYCPPHLVNFSNIISFGSVGIRSIFWDFGDFSYSNLQNPSHIYTYAGIFNVKLEVEFINGCVDSLSIDNYINIGGAVGNLTLSQDSICNNDCIFLNANSVGAVSHYWIFPDGLEAGLDTITHCFRNWVGRDIPAVVLTDNQTPLPCSYVLYSRDTLLVDSVYTYFSANVQDTACSNYPIQFTDLSVSIVINQVVRWHWDFGDGDTSALQHPLHTFLTPGFKTVTLTAYNALGCFDSYSRTYLIIQSPVAAFAVSDSLGCDSLSTVFTDVSVAGNFPIVSWYWDFDDLGITSTSQGPVNHTYFNIGAYNPILIVSDAYGCSDTAYQLLNVYPVPNGIAGQDTILLCLGDSIVLLGDPSYASYDWTPGLYLSDSTIAQPTAYAVDTITYILITTDFTTCQSFDTVTINVLPLPPLLLYPYPDTNICLFDTVQLFANGSISYQWTPAIEISDPNAQNPFVFPTTTRFYTVTTTDQYGCRSTDRVKVIINRFFPQFEAERSCLGTPTDIVSVSSSSDRNIVQWFWDFGDNSNPNDQATGRFTAYTYPDSGFYHVTMVVMDNIGCTDTLIKTIRVDIPPVAFAGTDTLICYGASVQLYSGGGVDSVYWTPNINITDAFIYNPIVNPSETTIYTAHVTNGNCPFDTANVYITVVVQPGVETIEDRTISKGQSIELITTSDGNIHSVIWAPADSTLSCVTCLSPVAKPDETTLYVVTVYDKFGCESKDSVLISVKTTCDEDLLFVANAFTPNGDGFNDFAYVRLFGVQKLNFYRVFDRWGKLLFETRNENVGWDGTNLKGEKLITGVFVYVAEAQCYNGQTIIKKGNITLLK
jgi:gliding motility-associated-like protein